MNVEVPICGLIKTLLEPRGWQVHIVNENDVKGELVDVVPDKGLLKCVDGRASNARGKDAMRGPKMLGGIYAIASMRGVTKTSGLKAIVDEVRKKGYRPSVHGHYDDNGKPDSMGCGYFKLWKNGCLPGLEAPSFTGNQGRDAVKKAKGAYEVLKDKHYECQVVLNLVAGKTLEPTPHNQQFIVDGWVLGDFKLDLLTYLGLAVSTVEQLSSTCRSIRVIMPSKVTT